MGNTSLVIKEIIMFKFIVSLNKFIFGYTTSIGKY